MNFGGRFLAWLDAPRVYALRALLRGEAHGNVIADRIRIDGYAIGPWRLYPALRAMEREGLLTAREVPDTDGTRGGQPRVVYALTTNGWLMAEAPR